MAIVAGSVNGLLCKRPARVTTWKNDADACYVVNDVTTGLRWRKGKSRRKEGGVGGGREEQRHRPTINLLFVIDIYTSIWPFFPTAHILSWALEVFSFPSRSSLDVFIDVY